MVETDFLAELATARPAPRGALRHPVRPGARAALALRGRARSRSCSPARAPTSRTAATGATRRPPLLGPLRLVARGARLARRGDGPRAAAGRERPPRRARARRDAATPSACCASSRSPTRRCASALLGGDRAGAAEDERPSARGGVLGDVAGPRPARAGALPRHAHVPARRHPDLQRQDVDGGEPRAARALPRRRADALRRAHPGAARGSGRAPASACTAWRWSGCCRAGLADRPKHGFATPYDDWLRASLGEEVERRYAPGSSRSPTLDPAGGRGEARRRAPPRARRPQAHPLLPARAVRVAPRVRRGARARRPA